MRRCCVCSGEQTVGGFRDEGADLIEMFIAHIPFCRKHEIEIEKILEEKEAATNE